MQRIISLIKQDRNTQTVKGKGKDIDKQLTFVIIIIIENLGDDKLHICQQCVIQDIIYKEHKKLLKKHNGIRLKNLKSTHFGHKGKELINIGPKDNWILLENTLK